MKLTKTFITLTITILTLAALTTTATARNLSSSATTFRATWTNWEYSGGFGTMRCQLTLEGTLRSSTITKARNGEIGSITGGAIGTCPAGSATILRETLPWRIQYSSFAGNLPNITSISVNLINYSVRLIESLFRITCLFRSSAEHPATGRFNLNASHAVTSVMLGGTELPCEGIGLGLSGTSSTNSALTITLI